jgi:large subunit ribosomal protein L4
MPSAGTPVALQAPRLGGGSVALDPAVFEARFNMALVHETVRVELAARRRGTASTRTRGEVSGGGSKPWRQKGTGRARAGSNRSPLWTGGGTVFGPSPRRYTFKVNRKERRAALRSALSAHAGRESLAVFDAGAFTEPSTRRAASLLADWGAPPPTLVILTDEEAAAGKSFRNLARVRALAVQDAGVADVIGAASLLVSEAALPSLVALATKPSRRAVGGHRGAEPDAPAAHAEQAEPHAPTAHAEEAEPDAPPAHAEQGEPEASPARAEEEAGV